MPEEKPPLVGDMQIEQDMEFERRDWVMQRVGWIVMLLMVVAALLGFLGQGPLTRLTAGGRGGPLAVEYYRFDRVQSPADLKVSLMPGSDAEGEVRVWIERQYMESISVEQITPEPAETEVWPDRLVFTFKRGDADGEAAIIFRFRHEEFGSHDARVGIVGGPEVSFSQFVYP